MLLCRQHVGSLFKRCCHHPLSAHRHYSSKVRAYPFAISKETAISELTLTASFCGGYKLCRTLLKGTFPSLNITGLQPLHIQPTYLPIWVVDAQFSADVWFQDKPDDKVVKDLAQLQFLRSNMPGFVHEPLSSISMLPPPSRSKTLTSTPTVPWSEELKTHDGETVMCVPFSLTPVHLPEAVRSLPHLAINISKNFRFDPLSVSASMMAVYPVLMPAYIAQFRMNSDDGPNPVTITAYMDASIATKNPRMVVEFGERFLKVIRWFGTFVDPYWVGGDNADAVHVFTGATSLNATTGQLSDTHRSRLLHWIHDAAGAGKALREYRARYFGETEREAELAVDWDDIRIRPFTAQERARNEMWLVFTLQLVTLMRTLEALEQGRTPPSAEANVEKVTKEIAALERKRDRLKPGWLETYEYQMEQRAKVPAKNIRKRKS